MDARPVVQEPIPADLGPISPELVLVDPVLAEQARKLLPDPKPARPRLKLSPLPPPRPQRRWPRTAAVAAVVFAAGAAAGGFLPSRHARSSAVVLEVRAAAPTTPRRQETRRVRHSKPTRARRTAAVSWAPNVLGVAAQVTRRGVDLVWSPPLGSKRVVVLRARGNRKRASVVFRGRASSLRDASLRPCTAYRYTIVNYDLRGRRSTGVPTSVVTNGCM